MEIFCGKNKEDLLGSKLEDIYEKEYAFKLLDAIEEAKEVGYSECEVSIFVADGKKIRIMDYFSAIKNIEGEITHLLGTLHPLD